MLLNCLQYFIRKCEIHHARLQDLDFFKSISSETRVLNKFLVSSGSNSENKYLKIFEYGDIRVLVFSIIHSSTNYLIKYD